MSLIDTGKNILGNTLPTGVNRTLSRLFGAGLEPGAESPLQQTTHAAWGGKDAQKDWRVSLTLPPQSPLRGELLDGPILKVLEPNGGIVFPLTPTINVSHTAHYQAMANVHNNFPFYAYQNSETSYHTVIGEFPVQNPDDAKMWIATLHFLRTVTKMFFGKSGSYQGNPPPILFLNGYGDYVFKNVPVVVTSFNTEMTAGVDYISTTRTDFVQDARDSMLAKGMTDNDLNNVVTQSYDFADEGTPIPAGWAPTMSNITVQIQPVYSRNALKNFSLKDFARGKQPDGYGFV